MPCKISANNPGHCVCECHGVRQLVPISHCPILSSAKRPDRAANHGIAVQSTAPPIAWQRVESISNIGVRLSEIIKRETGAAVPCGDCKAEILRLNQMTADQVLSEINDITDGIITRAKELTPNWYQRWALSLAPWAVRWKVKSWIREACHELAAITCLFNPTQSTQIIENYRRFRESLGDVPLCTVELVLDGDPVAIPDAIHVYGTRDRNLCWQKERLLNIALAKVPPAYREIAWLDADVILPATWYRDTIAALTRFPVVQLFRQAHLLAADGSTAKTVQSIAGTSPGLLKHPGFAWAAHRSILAHGFWEQSILGGGDILMAAAFQARAASPPANSIDLRKRPWIREAWDKWAEQVTPQVMGQVGALSTDLTHLHHGHWSDRQYLTRYEIADQSQLQPDEVFIDDRKLWAVDNPEFRRLFGEYMANRRDDPRPSTAAAELPVFVTSFSPRAGAEWQTWQPFASQVLAVQSPGEPAPETGARIDLAPTICRGRPLQKIADMVRSGRERSAVVVIINDDISMHATPDHWQRIIAAAQTDLVCIQRQEQPSGKRHILGIDTVLVPPTLDVPDDDRFLLGECAWDWWLPLLAREQRISIRFVLRPVTHHQSHEINWDLESYHESCRIMREQFGVQHMDKMKHSLMSASERI